MVYSGRYVAEVTATNEVGAVTLGATFTVRRRCRRPKKKRRAEAREKK